MFSTANKLFYFLDSKLKISAVIIFILVIISMIIETFSIGLIIPAITLLSESNLAENYPYISKILASLSPIKFFTSSSSVEIKNHDIIAGGMIVFLIVYLIKAVYLLFFYIVKGKFVFKIEHSLTQQFIKGYLRLPYSFFSSKNSSELIRNIAYETRGLSNSVDLFLTLLTELFVLIGIVSLLIYVQTAIALLTLFIFGVATYYFHFFTKKKIFNLGQTRQIHEERRLNFLNQILGGIKEVKIYNTETEFVKNYLSTSNKVFKSDMWMNIINLSPKLWLELIAVFSLTILIFAMILQSDEQISIIATLALFAAAAFRLLPSINRAVNSVQKIKYYLPIINTLHGELRMINNTNINITDQKIDFSKNLILDKVNFSYPNSKKKILDEIKLNISKFSTVGIMGKTGSGKSTLANILIGLLSFNEGKIISDNIELKEKTINWGHKIGYVPQNIFLINDTIRRNIAFGIPENKIDNTKVINSLNLAQLNEMVNNFPEGLNTFVGERGVRLSGGQIQRIGIARALYHDPEFLVLDEATSALDVDTEKEFIKVVLKVSDKKTIFIISHRSSVLKFCDVVYKLEKGKLYNIKLN